MLWNIDKQRKIVDVPRERKADYELWCGRIDSSVIVAMKQEINTKVSGNEVNTAGWLPKKEDWERAPFKTIYETACHKNVNHSGQFFGLLVWVTMVEREDDWGFGRYSVKEIPIESMTYFKIERPLW